MRRRAKPEPQGTGTAAELRSYEQWCLARNLVPFGDLAVPGSLALARGQQGQWEAERAAHGIVDQCEEELPGDSLDPDDALPHAGLWSRPHGVAYGVACNEHGLAPDRH